jgi:hypothetical protein
MTAIASNAVRDTARQGFDPLLRDLAYPVAANVNCRQGGIAVLGAAGAADAGYLKPGVAGLGLVCVGRFSHSFDNTGGANAGTSLDFPAGRTVNDVESGTFWWGNSASTDQITQANCGQLCYIVDDQTVALTSAGNTRSVAGIIAYVDTVGRVAVTMGESISLAAASASGTARIQTGTNTLASGTRVVSADITANSRIFVTVKDPGAGAITGLGALDVPVGTRVVGLATGVGAFTVNAIDDSKVLISTAACTFDWMVVG